MKNAMSSSVYTAILVASLGYFVDIYDLILFSIVRVPSLRELGITSDQQLLDTGLLLLNVQMFGMILGGIGFGIMGDKVGRLSVLFGSILLYSVANLANGFIHDTSSYLILRFLAGIGLAGELGAGITLVSELLPAHKRGFGTTFVATLGVTGALWAWFVADKFSWRNAYIIGGIMGLALLLLRFGVRESGIFTSIKEKAHIHRGQFLSLFKSKLRLKKLLACVGIGVPIWYVIGILITLSPEFATVLNINGQVNAGRAVFYCYSGLILGDLLSGLLSQYLKSRRRSIFIFLTATTIGILGFFFLTDGMTLNQFYALCFYLGTAVGYWAMFVTVAAEQFGTNIRATVTTCTPNFVRGSLVPLSLIFTILRPLCGLIFAGLLVGILALSFAFWGYRQIQESFSTDLDFFEE